MIKRCPVRVLSLCITAMLAGALAGCGAGSVYVPPLAPYVPPVGNYAGAPFGGAVTAGGAPLVGASVQMYAAGAAGNGSAPTQLLATALTTDATGSVSVPAGYTCPFNTSVLYIVSTGGRLNGTGTANSAVVLMTSPGACSTVTAGSTYRLNEVTTVASAYAMAQFLKPGAQLGASSTNGSGLTLAAATLANLVNLKTGAAPGAGFPATGTAPVAKINSLANAVNACVVSGAACAQLYAAATAGGVTPATTLDAVVNVAQHPGAGVAGVYAVSTGSGAFSPALTAAPPDWVLYVSYTGGGMNDPSAVSVDSTGRVWVANYFSVASLFSNTGAPVFPMGISGNLLGASYGGAVDANDNMWITNEPTSADFYVNSVTVLSASGTAPNAPFGAGGLNYPIAVSIDSRNIGWVVDYGNSHLSLLDSSGNSQAGTSGYDGVDSKGNGTFIFPVAVAVDSRRNGWVANQSSNTVVKVPADGSSFTSYACCNGASGVAVDGGDNVWVANFYGDSVGLVSAAGSILSGTGFKGGGVAHPQGIAVDGKGNVWVANYRGPALSELAGVGASAGTGTVLSPAKGWAPDAALLEAFGLAIDASGNVWVSSFGNNTLTEFVGMAAPVKTPLLGPVRVP